MDSNDVYEDDNINNDCDEDEANNDDYKDAGAAVENYIADHWGKERGHGSIYSIYTFWERGAAEQLLVMSRLVMRSLKFIDVMHVIQFLDQPLVFVFCHDFLHPKGRPQ